MHGEARGHPGRSSFNDFQRVGFLPTFLADRRCCGLEGRAPLNAHERVDSLLNQGDQQQRSIMNTMKNLGVALALGALAVIGFSGCAGTRYEQSTGEHIDDNGTSRRVKGALADDSVYKYPDVNVSTFKGTTQLSGFVNQRAQKDRAGDLSKKVAGVKEVVNNITIKE